MIYKWLISHQIKESRRSSFWQKQLILNIVIGFFILLMLLYVLALGLLIDKILMEVYPGKNPVEIFNGGLLYYFAMELILRFMIQSLPTINIIPYLHLPVNKTAIVNYLNLRSLLAVGNYLPLLVFIPFSVKVIVPLFSGFVAFIWILTLFLIALSNNFFAVYIKRQLTGKPLITLIASISLITVILLDYFDILSVNEFSKAFFGQVLIQPLLVFVPVPLLITCYFLNFRLLYTNLYPGEINQKRQEMVGSSRADLYFQQYGFIGQLILKDLKLIWRNKRTRSIVYMAPLFLGYGLLLYPQPIYMKMNGFLIFIGIFMTGGMMLNYLNYVFSYESGHFDFILTKYTDIGKYLQQKLLFSAAISTISFIITIPYVYFGMKILFINTMTWLYNLGVLSYILLYSATFSSKKMDLSKSATFNYQGLGASNWLSILPFFLLPLFFYFPFSYFNLPYFGLSFIGLTGFCGLIFYKPLMQIIVKQFMKRKYKMAEGFRQG